jgi:hypothetical protein
MHRKLVNLHLAIAAFFFPMALMFALTGGLYTVEVKGSYTDTKHAVALSTPFPTELPALLTLAGAELDARGIAHPSGRAGLRKAGTSVELEWTGAARDVALRPTSEPGRAELVIRETSAWRHLVQLHKAKGGAASRAFSVAWAVGLLLVLGSGLGLGLGAKAYRRRTLIGLGAGVLGFIAYVLVG